MGLGPIAEIRTPRLILHPLDPSDADEMATVLGDPALYEFTGGAPPALDDLRARYRAQVSGPDDRAETWFNWIIRTLDDRTAIGFVQATVVGETADVAWLIGVEHQRNGFASEAAGAMCEWLVRRGARPLTAHVHPDHVASERVAATLGLTASGDLDDDGERIWRSSVPHRE